MPSEICVQDGFRVEDTLSIYGFTGRAEKLRRGGWFKRRLWVGLLLVLLVAGSPGQAQTDAWHSGAIGLRWALRVADYVPRADPGTLLASFDDPSGPELLIAADKTGALAVDVDQARVAWQLRRSIKDWETEGATPPLLRDDRLYLYDTALDARTGQPLWESPTGPIVSMSLVGDVVYLVSLSETWALNAGDGLVLWRAVAETEPGQSGSRPLALGDTLVVHTVDGQVRGLDARGGGSRWRLPIEVAGRDVLTGSGEWVYAPQAEVGQLLAFDSVDGAQAWSYPATDSVGTYAAPRLLGDAEPLVDGETLYVADAAGRILALEAGSGAVRWASEPLLPGASGPGGMRRVGDTLVVWDLRTALLGLDAESGRVLWRRDDTSGQPPAVVASDLLLVEGQENGLRLIQAGTGQVAAELRAETEPPPVPLTEASYEIAGAPYHDRLPLGSAASLVEGGDGFAYLVEGPYLIALGPAAPGEAVAMARAFLARGDYRSAARTLSLLKASDEAGYLAHGGEALAAKALDAWLDDFERTNFARNFENVTSIYWPDDLSYDAAQLGIHEAQARMKYADARAELAEFEANRRTRGGIRSAAQIREVRQLMEGYGDTEWAERMAVLLEGERRLAAPRLGLGGPAYLDWWYLPFLLPLLVLLAGVIINRQRQGIYRSAVAAGLSIWGGLVYLFWVARLLTYPVPDYQVITPLLGLDLALILGVPTVVLLLTRSKSLALATLVVSVVNRFVIYGSLLTMLG